VAFTPESPKTPAIIGDISVVLTDYLDEIDTARYEVQVLQADGDIFRVATGDLAPHLSAGQISALHIFMADMRTLAQGLLP